MPRPLRIVSLLPSCTEIVAAIVSPEHLVGRSHECDYPPQVRSLPVCTKATFAVDGSSESIHRNVEARLRQALSLYEVDMELLQSLSPDVILTQAQCEVCAVSEQDLIAALSTWTGKRPQLVSLSPLCLADVWNDILRVGEAIGERPAAERLHSRLNATVRQIELSAARLSPRPRVLCIEWLDPLMAAGNWAPELVSLAGGAPLLAASGVHSAWTNPPAIRAAEPEVIVSMPCGFDLEKTAAETRCLAQLEIWSQLPAVQSGQVYVVDGNQYFNRPGPRLVESLEILAEILHPEEFQFGHAGRGWRRLEA